MWLNSSSHNEWLMKTLFLNNYVIIDIIIRNYDVGGSVTGKISYFKYVSFNLQYDSFIDDVIVE